jgi:hypothetical protein
MLRQLFVKNPGEEAAFSLAEMLDNCRPSQMQALTELV